MAPGAQKQVTQFVSHEVAKNHSLPHAAAVGELLGIVRENVGDDRKAPVVWIECESKAVLSTSYTFRHGLRQDSQRQLGWPGGDLASGKLAGVIRRQGAIQPLNF